MYSKMLQWTFEKKCIYVSLHKKIVYGGSGEKRNIINIGRYYLQGWWWRISVVRGEMLLRRKLVSTRSAGGGDSGDGGDGGDGGEPRRRRQSRTDDGRAMNHWDIHAHARHPVRAKRTCRPERRRRQRPSAATPNVQNTQRFRIVIILCCFWLSSSFQTRFWNFKLRKAQRKSVKTYDTPNR